MNDGPSADCGLGVAYYHPDPIINAEVVQQTLEAERADLAAGYPPRAWTCPCGATHSRGHHLTIGTHRCLSCGYVGTEGIMRGKHHTRDTAPEMGKETTE